MSETETAATEDLEGTFRRFAEELCTDTKEVLGNHLRRKTTHKLNDYEVAAILNDWYRLEGCKDKYKEKEKTQKMFNNIFSRLRIQPINLDDATPSVRTHKKYVNMPVIVIVNVIVLLLLLFSGQ